MFDLALLGGCIVTEGEVIKANLYVKEGKIAALTLQENLQASKTIEASGFYILPGGIDPHSHFNDPGYTDGEDYYSGTAAAAAGGVTTIFDMPQTIPVTADYDSFHIKKREAAKKAVVNHALYLALTPENLHNVQELMELKPVGFKAFMTYSPEIPMLNDAELYAGMKNLSKTGARLALHCENDEITHFLTEELKSEGKIKPIHYTHSRPPFCEWEAVQRAISLAKITSTRLHVVHTSIPECPEIVQLAKKEGYEVSIETAPHYLILTKETLFQRGPYAQCNPPLRDRESRELLWQQVNDEVIDCIGSDHAPYTFTEKDVGKKDIWQSPAGVTAIQTMMPLVIGAGLRRGVAWPTLTKMLSSNAARLFGFYPQKGVIQLGSDADLVIYDPEEEWQVLPKALFYKQPWTPYEGMIIKGRVKRTLIKGETVFIDGYPRGKITVEPGFGSFLPGKALNI